MGAVQIAAPSAWTAGNVGTDVKLSWVVAELVKDVTHHLEKWLEQDNKCPTRSDRASN